MSDSEQNPNQSLPNVPPPPLEVKVRTLRSDLESMAKSGGAVPQFQTVKGPSLADFEKQVADATEKPANKTKTIVVAVLAILLTLGIVYFSYQILLKSSSTTTENVSPSPVAAGPQAPVQPAGFTHHSSFKSPPDEVLALMIGKNTQGGISPQTYTQQIRDLGYGIQTPAFYEVGIQGADGHDLTMNETFSAAGAAPLDPSFALRRFNSDLTVFVYRDRNGLWPGYVLALKPSENWLFLRDEVSAQLEKPQKMESFFVSSPGSVIGGFKDTVVNGQPARVLKFSSGASFVYGWFRGYLILSTSEEGLKEAAARL
ncbi:MAG: hypothetical protein HY434_02785 [Candidatus Liptonbacteria bacterium]|nr:hypothetical protein [Candidatus Liptonbacteria bacterium]